MRCTRPEGSGVKSSGADAAARYAANIYINIYTQPQRKGVKRCGAEAAYMPL
jgi:hypothetical protein